jgi:hypothetical protein
MASLLDFIERVRTLQDLPPLGMVVIAGTLPDDDEACVLAAALGCPVRAVGQGDDEWLYAMCFGDRLVARRVGIIMELPWRAEPPAVRVPDEVADLAVAQHHGRVEGDDIGLLHCWWVPSQDAEEPWWSSPVPVDRG